MSLIYFYCGDSQGISPLRSLKMCKHNRNAQMGTFFVSVKGVCKKVMNAIDLGPKILGGGLFGFF